LPENANLSFWAKDLITKLICEEASRIGINGVDEIKTHQFFSGIDWTNLRNM